jgi:hypothetical protein
LWIHEELLMSTDLLPQGLAPRLARRGVLGAGAATLGVAALPGTAEAVTSADPDVTGRRTWGGTELPPTIQRRILTRFTYGFTQDDYQRMRDAPGWSAWFERQLTPTSVPDPRLDEILASLPDLYLPAADQALQANTGRKPATHVQQQYFAATVARRVYSTRQVEAMMEDFWSNHFYVPGQLYLHPDYTRTLRQLAFGPVRGPAGRRRAPPGDAAVALDLGLHQGAPEREPGARDAGAAHGRSWRRWLHRGHGAAGRTPDDGLARRRVRAHRTNRPGTGPVDCRHWAGVTATTPRTGATRPSRS